MLKKSCLVYVLILLGIAGCTKKETRSFDIAGDISGNVITYNEYGLKVNDKGNIAITLTGSDLPVVYTDTAGNFTLNEVPLGTYSLSISKDGYGPYVNPGFSYTGNVPSYRIGQYLVHKSSTKIVDYTLSVTGNYLHFSGSITHIYPKSIMYYPFTWPAMAIYISSSANISSSKNSQEVDFYSDQNSDTNFADSTYIYSSLFPHGSTIYALICGRNSMIGYQLYDFVNGNYYDPCLGEPSTVKSIIIP